MFLRILKKDIKRKKTMNIIMLVFIILASMFVASGLNNVITIANGTDYFFDQARLGDYIAARKGSGEGVATFDEILPTIGEIKSYRLDEVIFSTKDTLEKEDGSELDFDNTLMIQSLEDSGLNYFYVNDKVATVVPEGHFYCSYRFAKNNNLKTGDKIVVKGNDVRLSLTFDGTLKDALFGSDMLNNARLFLSKADFENYRDNGVSSAGMIGEFAYIDTDDVGAVDVALTEKCPTLMLNRPRSTIKAAYFMNMVLAFITLILSVCLIIVSFVILRFTITFTITEEYREIGVMKAIGIRDIKIKSLYLTKYLVISVLGSLIGFALSFPFSKLLLDSVTKTMVLGNGLGLIPNIIGSLLVVLSILGFAYLATGVVKKATPVDAIRKGQTGERFKKKSKLKLSKSKTNSVTFMAVNDVLSNKKKYITVAAIFALCASFVLVMTNTVNTMKSDRLIDSFSARSDLYYSDQDKQMSFMHEGGNEELQEYVTKVESDLDAMGMPGHVFVDAQYILKVTSNDNEYSVSCQQGIGSTIDMYVFTQGTAPQNMYEIAITPTVSKKINAHIGDTVTVDYGTGPVQTTVTAYFQSMNWMGEVIRIHETAPTNLKNCTSWMAFQINFNDHPSSSVLRQRKQKLIEYFGDKEVQFAWEYQADCIGVVPTMETVQKLLLAITIVVITLVVVLMERSFISDEKNEIAILKAVGFKDRRVILYHMIRFGLATLVAVIFAGAISIPLTYLTIGPIFQSMGMTTMTFAINPLSIFVVYPLIILAATLLVAFVTSLITKTIKSSDTASIE